MNHLKQVHADRGVSWDIASWILLSVSEKNKITVGKLRRKARM